MAETVKGDTLLFLGVGFLAGLGIIYAGFNLFKRKRLIEDIPTSKVRSIAMGLVELQGKAQPTQKTILKSPLSGKNCVYYKFLVEKYVKRGKHSSWQTLKKGETNDPFYLEDNTGAVLVSPKKAEISVKKSYESKSRWGKDPEPNVMNFLKKENISFEGLFGANHEMRFREWIIAPHETVYVMGEAGDNPYVDDGSAKYGHEDIMISRGKEKIMMISNKKEEQVLKSLAWQSIGLMIGGFVLSLVCLIGFMALIKIF